MKTPFTFPRRIPAVRLDGLRRRAEGGWGIDPGEVNELVDEIERIYASAVAEVKVEVSPLPRVGEYPDGFTAAVPYVNTHITIVAKILNPLDPENPWIGARVETIHAVQGPNEEAVKLALDEAVGP